jgi:MFS family permease
VLTGRRRAHESRASEQGGLPDAFGIVLLIESFGALAYGIVAARETPSIAPPAILLGLALLALFVLRSLRVSVPALDVRLFRRRTFAIANAMSLVFSIAFTAMFFGNVLFLTERWHLSIFEAGLWISPGPLTVIPVAILAGRRADRTGYRPPFVAGGLLFAMGAAWMLHVANEGAALLLWLPPSIAMGSAVGLVLPSLSGAAALELDAATLGVGSGVNQAIRQFGSVLGVAVVVVMVGRPGEGAPFERVFVLLLVAGLLTALGGLTMPAPGAEKTSPAA